MAEKKNLWARSANPKERAKAYGAHEKNAKTREVKTTNVVRQSVWDKLTNKPGEMKRR